MKPKPELDLPRFIDALELAAKRQRVKMRVLAAETGVSAPTLSKIKRGQSPGAAAFIALCCWAKLTPADFLIQHEAISAAELEYQSWFNGV